MGFVTYDNAESVNFALAHPGHILHGQQLSVEVCISKDKGAGKGPPSGKALPGFENSGDRLFVTKIPPEATREEVESFFSQFGAWTDLYLPNGSFPAGHKGICFISYESPTSVQMALQAAPQAILRGQQLVLDVAAPRDPHKGASKGAALMPAAPMAPVQAWGAQPQQTFFSPSLMTSMPAMPVVAGIPNMQMVQPQPLYQQPSAFAPSPGYAPAAGFAQTSFDVMPSQPPGTGQQVPGRLFLTKVAQDITKEDLVAYFQQYGELSDVFVPSGGKFIAFVSFADPFITQTIVQSREHEVKVGRTVNVELAYDRPPQE